MQAVERIEHRNASKNFWLHVAFQAVHGGAHRESTDSCDLLPAPPGKHPADDGAENASFGHFLYQNDYFTKTGSGQTYGKLKKPGVSLGYRNAGYGSALHSLDHGVKNITDALKQVRIRKPSPPFFECINDHFAKTDSGQA